ncbi:MAG: pirin [Solidesulfovibrio sp.]|uniref:plasmid mobilization protein n=1 Tax=Solidesulfovibrio sp. TaxID=2910990 RepID=UPI002B1F29C3|nr:pirin [Solidesulfovibrio sp.]MEA4855374.1 pirin [Solidesulfovibrio sp.]
MPSKKTVMKSYLTPEEYEKIIESADRAGLSLSTFAKRVCLGQPVPSLETQKARLELFRINADLGRLGGLFKLCLSDKEGPFQAMYQEIRRILREIEAGQRELRAAVARI